MSPAGVVVLHHSCKESTVFTEFFSTSTFLGTLEGHFFCLQNMDSYLLDNIPSWFAQTQGITVLLEPIRKVPL